MNYQNNLQVFFFYLDDTLDHTFYFTFLIPHNIASDLLQSISELELTTNISIIFYQLSYLDSYMYFFFFLSFSSFEICNSYHFAL